MVASMSECAADLVLVPMVPGDVDEVHALECSVFPHPWSRGNFADSLAVGYDAWVLAYELSAVAAISTAYPFEREVDGHHSYVTFVTDADVLDELAGVGVDASSGEKIERGQGVVYWQVPRSGTLDSTIGKTMGKKRYKSSTTTRNPRTLEKVLAK